MATAARLPLAADRYTSCVRTIRFRGFDLTGLTLRLQVRLIADTPGAPLVDLGVVTNGNEQGLRILPAEMVDGVPVTPVIVRINETTMEGLPYAGELGEATVLAYDMIATFGNDKRRLAYGDFAVIAGVTGADNAPAGRPSGYGGRSSAQTWTTAEVAFKGDNVTVSLEAIDLLMPIAQAAQVAADAVAAQLPGIRDDITLTRDLYAALTQKVLRQAFGTITYAGGVRTVVKPTFVITSCGHSLMHNYNGDFSKCFGEKLKVKLQARMPNHIVEHDINVGQYPVDGSWAAQISAQIARFPRKPDLVLGGSGQNDAIANIMMGYQGFVGPGNTYGGYEAALENVSRQIRDMGCAFVHVNSPYPDPTQSMAEGRFTVTPEVLMSWPQTSLIAFFLRIKFTEADQRISAYAVNGAGELVPFDLFNQYSNGLFGPGKFLLEFKDSTTGAMHQALEVAADGTWCRVDNTILADKDDGTSVRQANFDNETEVFPPLSQRIVQRDPSGTGALVDMSWGHWEIAIAGRRIAQRNGFATVDWAAILGSQIITNADYTRLFRDGLHPFDEGYDAADTALDALADDIAFGTVPAGRIYAEVNP
jgi:hypothetical protein